MTDAESFFEELDEPVRSLMLKIRQMILSASDRIEERLSYGIPFYFYFGRLFYLNPGNRIVEFGFCRGSEMMPSPLFGNDRRKEVRSITFHKIEDIKPETFKPLIYEALLMNELRHSVSKVKNLPDPEKR